MICSAQKAVKCFSNAKHHRVSALGNGLINDTFLLRSKQTSFVLQRINTLVFPDPEQIMDNLVHLNQHQSKKGKP
ncbi:MAG: hypothetical protein HFP78_03980 [Methylococcales symbiont of Hymedesmia sp. n. MRB-2018]|nr:MAG: hypothetical protein HFP78_03980 [Methylococcales symbiont of Hymedesmia sp. n. MRB-2018]